MNIKNIIDKERLMCSHLEILASVLAVTSAWEFRTCIMYIIYSARIIFLNRVAKRKVSATLLRTDSITDALSAIFKILKTSKGNTCGGASLPCSHRWVGGLNSLNFLKGTLSMTLF